MDVTVAPGWLTWVGATTACLRALGVQCDNAEVAGRTGYAFTLNVPKTVGVWGPTAFVWSALRNGLHELGRSTLEFYGQDQNPTTFRAAYDLVAREVEAGRPCLINGAFVPEFAAVVGVQDGYYHLVGAIRDEPLHCEKLDAPGGVYVLAFPTEVTPGGAADRMALHRATRLLRDPELSPLSDQTSGLAGYDAWINELQARRANEWGNSYCAQCFAEARRFAAEFVGRLAGRHPDNEPLQLAVEPYLTVVEAMNRVSQLFPFPGKENQTVQDPITIDESCAALREAQVAETRAADAMTLAVAAPWPEG
jgi:hypothetical protein